MVSWSQFPPEIKRKIAENYDFMSRNTCHVDRQIVDSTKIRIPRVRFGYKEDKCLICIYTGIEKFLRLEIQKFGSGVIVYKSENSPYLTDSIRNLIPCTLPLNEGLLIFKSLLAHKSIQISTMEWELESFNIDKLGKQMIKLLGNSKFSVKKLELVQGTDDFFLEYLYEICHWNEVEIVQKLEVNLSPRNINSVSAIDYKIADDWIFGKPMSYTYYFTNQIDVNSDMGKVNDYMMENESGKLHWYTHREPNNEDCSFSEDYRFEGGNVIHTRRSPCGMWINRCHGIFAKELKAIHDLEICGIGNLCPKHADPFDYWYHQNLPRRLIQEPFWNGFNQNVFLPTSSIGLDILRGKMRTDENRRMKKMTKKRNRMKYSWGFGRPNQTTSEAFKVSLEVEKRKSRFGTWFKIIFLPIFISFVFYAIFIDNFFLNK
ncbi:hypothetical protein B9Z55_026822 [Caenorhabditis nigoni]|uniref:Uncharacterized protein n=1 Tax=Caenorhabditis nigoni TaxID=1611254 RepID=A0A2G5SHM2_9PELO|nr:hypothetical protein B9Z55_026822 [Caenorhabditis nigoni]